MDRHDLGDVSLLRADDELLDRVGEAAGRGGTPRLGWDRSPCTPRHRRCLLPTDPLEPLLTAWRRELAARPVRPAPARVVRRALRECHPARPVIAVAAAICSLVLASGLVGARMARPGDALWPVSQVVWPAHATSALAVDRARTDMALATQALRDGDHSAAVVALDRVAGQLAQVARKDVKQQLEADYGRLLGAVRGVAGAAQNTGAARGGSTGGAPVRRPGHPQPASVASVGDRTGSQPPMPMTAK